MPPMGRPSNPAGYGLSKFVQAFANRLDQKRQQDAQLRGKEAYYKFMEQLLAKKQAGAVDLEKEKAKGAIQRTKVQASSKASPEDRMLKVVIDSADKAQKQMDTEVNTTIGRNYGAMAKDPSSPEYAQMKKQMRLEWLKSNPSAAEAIELGRQAREKVGKMKGLGSQQSEIQPQMKLPNWTTKDIQQ